METAVPVDVLPNAHVGNTDVNKTETVAAVPEPDILSKVSKFRKESQTPPAENFFDFKEIEGIQDPKAKEIAIKAYKSMQAGLTRKTQELAEQRKSLETKETVWTPDRIQKELLNNPQFLMAAQSIAGTQLVNHQNSGLTNQEYSALSDTEKAEFNALKNKLSTLEQQNFASQRAQQHASLQQKYADYNPAEIDAIWNDLTTGKIQATPEHLYWAFKGPEIAKASYEYAKEEIKKLNQERFNGATNNISSSVNDEGMPVREKGDTDIQWFMKLGKFRLAQHKNRS